MSRCTVYWHGGARTVTESIFAVARYYDISPKATVPGRGAVFGSLSFVVATSWGAMSLMCKQTCLTIDIDHDIISRSHDLIWCSHELICHSHDKTKWTEDVKKADRGDIFIVHGQKSSYRTPLLEIYSNIIFLNYNNNSQYYCFSVFFIK